MFVINVDGTPKGYVNRCPHMGGSLQGAGAVIRCQWHGLTFEAATGVGKARDGQNLETAEIVLEVDDLFYVSAEKSKSPWADDF